MPALRIIHANQSRTHHRREGEGHQQADQDRDRRRDSELVQETSGDGRHERNRQEDDDERQSCSQYSQTDVFRRFSRRFFRVNSLFFNEAEDVFEHDDRVVDNHADHQHERQHRHAIEREVERLHHAERRDYRTRDRDRGDQRRAPRAHEQQHDKTRENTAEHQVGLNFVQRRFDVARLVANDLDFDVFRQLRSDARQSRPSGL